ncbi:MAG: Sensory transduction protein regX3 [Phycisphaerae bacterium]|nr:Sensory transduction protein regX3 [Phycisphaerae bacterium]
MSTRDRNSQRNHIGGGHILVIEDEQHLAAGLKYNLAAEGYEVTCLDNGPEAIALIERGDTAIDLVILDLMLPGMSGYHVCESLRSAGHEMPVLILSARTLAEDRARGFDVGADQYMMKPFDLDELLSRVAGLLRRRRRGGIGRAEPPPPPATFAFGEAKINFDTFEVTVGDQAVRLTSMEMKLLRYFVQNEGRMIPRSELLDNVWEMAPHASTRAPDQFMMRLRKTFEPDPGQPRHFLTIRDAGYRFVADPDAGET